MRRFDLARIKSDNDCRDVARRLWGEPDKEYHGYAMWRCPVHDDSRASLSVQSDWIKCHACGWNGDVFELVRKVCYGNMGQREGFVEACRWLGGEALDSEVAPSRFVRNESAPYKHVHPPSRSFQAVLEQISEAGVSEMPNSEGMAYLQGARGITLETAREQGIGYLDLEGSSRGRAVRDLAEKAGVRLPFKRGILFPWRAGGDLYGIRVRRIGPHIEKSFRYTQVTSMRPRPEETFGPALGAGLYLADFIRRGVPGILIEGEINALTVWQEARDLVSAFSLGAAPELMDSRWFVSISRCTRVLSLYDLDHAGAVGQDHARRLSSHIEPVDVAGVKDVNALHVDASGTVQVGAVRFWVRQLFNDHLARQRPSPEGDG